MKTSSRVTTTTLFFLTAVLASSMTAAQDAAQQPAPKGSSPAAAVEPSGDTADAALERTRKMVRMLDDIYKGGIVTITTHYVNDRDAIPAGTAFKMLFKAAEEKGWHRVRLLDGTGHPLNEENIAADEFEKAAVKALVGGKAWYEREIKKDGRRYLQVGTPIPVVFEKCVMCHDNFANVPRGKAIGALAYTLPIE